MTYAGCPSSSAEARSASDGSCSGPSGQATGNTGTSVRGEPAGGRLVRHHQRGPGVVEHVRHPVRRVAGVDGQVGGARP